MKRLLILPLVCTVALTAFAEKKPSRAPVTEKKEEVKPAEEKKEEEKPSPPPSGPQTDGVFRKVVMDVDQKTGDKYEDTLSDPMELTVAPDGRFFFVERAGKVKMWRTDTQASIEIGKIEVFTEHEDGLLGITLDPNFPKNGWLYLMYSMPETGTNAAGTKVGTNRVSRFTFAADKLDLKSEKPLIDIATQRGYCCHAGGSLAFDRHGNLFISTGDNTNPHGAGGFAPIDQRENHSPWDAQKSSANANDLRGKVLRIRPQSDGSYTIPEGNLFAEKSKTAPAQTPDGGAALPVQSSSGNSASRPEIYVMGCRNPFRISVDSKTDFLYFGDVGPDAKQFTEMRGPAGFDEVNQARAAGNFGWPYFIGENKPYWIRNFSKPTNSFVKLKFNPLKPFNQSPNNTGLKILPPAQGAFISYPDSASVKFPALNGEGGRTVMAGPVYNYDENLKSDRKLPQEFDRTLFIYEWSRSWIVAVKLTQDGMIEKMERFCPNMSFKRPIDMELGPDGCLYIVEWGTAWGKNKDTQIVRVEYAPELAKAK